MSEQLEDTWTSRDPPILRAALRRLDAGDGFPDLNEIREELGFSSSQMRSGLDALRSADPPYIDVRLRMGGWNENRSPGHVRAVSERARRELGTWPSADTVVDSLAAALNEAAEAEQEPEKRSRLRAAAEAVGGAARDVMVGVIAKKLGDV